MASPAENAQAIWTTPECPFAIVYGLRVLDDIRLAVTDAFFSLPRGGAEIGGLLLGTYDGGQVVISGYAALDVEHAFGPSFTLSPRDEGELALSLRRHHGQVVGWYHSHTRSEIFLSEADQALHSRFFPEPWQVALVLKPHTFEPMRAGFFFHQASGAFHSQASYREFTLEALPLRPLPSGEPPPDPGGNRVDSGFTGRVITVEASPVEPGIPSVPEDPPKAAPLPRQEPEPRKSEMAEAVKSRTWWVAALCVLLGSAFGAWAYQTRALWLPGLSKSTAAKASPAAPAVPAAQAAPPYIGLSASGKDAQLQIRWDRESPAVRSASSAVLTLTEGVDSTTIPLEREQLLTGATTYIRKAERVTVSMTVQQQDGHALRETTQFQAPPPDPAMVRRGDDLKTQNDQLKAALSRQAERARKAEKSLEAMRKASQRKRLTNQLPDAVK
jgi:proteasome lid subunit RPN8/RPN11